MIEPTVSLFIKTLRQRSLDEGGFANIERGGYRSDATAWAILALTAAAEERDLELIDRARRRLADEQQPDGRIFLSPDPQVYWPTPLAILAWHRSPAHLDNLSRAAHFLLNHSGIHYRSKTATPDLHDSSLKGWPWVDQTYSWVAPTALGIIALTTAGYGEQMRVAEARRLLLDRRCRSGGWNYGNKFIFGSELRPTPEDTGVALNALKGAADQSSLAPSLGYLKEAVQTQRTPLALSWSLLGLTAWGERPAAASAWLSECWRRQERYGSYDTTSLALLACAALSSGGLEGVFPEPAGTRTRPPGGESG